MKTYGGTEVEIHVHITLALVGSEWSASRPGRFNSVGRAVSVHWI
jgi:hypothetical protein